MNKTRSLCLAVFFVAALSISANADIWNARFVSLDGGFSIDLPTSIDQGVRPVGSMSTGAATYTWKVPEGDFTVGFVNEIRGANDAFLVLNELADTVSASIAKAGGTLTERIEFNSSGNPGIQLKIARSDSFSINRFILVNDRLYILSVNWKEGTESSRVRILDSFEVIDTKALIA